METHNQDNPPTVELPNDENKLFDEADGVGNSTIPDLSLPSEDEEEEHTINNVWEYAINDLFQLFTSHVEGKSLRSWVHSEQMESMKHEWEEHVIVAGATETSCKGNSWGNNTEFLKSNSIRNLHMLWKYLHHLANKAEESSFNDDPYSLMGPEEFHHITRKQFMHWMLEHSSQQAKFPNGNGNRGYTQQDSRPESNQSAHQLLTFKKSIKREVSHYTTLKDERYFKAFKRNLLVTATTNGCEEVLDGTFRPANSRDDQELFQQKKYFMYGVFNKVLLLQNDMGKTIVRKYAPTLDAQSVWREF